MLCNENIDQVDSFTHLGSIISKDGGYSEFEKFWRIHRIETWNCNFNCNSESGTALTLNAKPDHFICKFCS